MAATTEGSAMQKKYIVRLTDAERATLTDVVKKLKGSSQKVPAATLDRNDSSLACGPVLQSDRERSTLIS
jgi:hypothetical protein